MTITREYWYFIAGALVVLIPLLALLAVKRLQLLEPRPDERIAFRSADGPELTLHAFHPRGDADEPAPALLLFHGGRWLYGDPSSLYPQCSWFAERGYACFSAQYRLGQHGRPDVRGAMADARAALDYLREHAGKLGIDPQRIVAGGGSSGGHLAAALGAGLAATPDAPRPAALVLYNPMLDLSPCTPDHHLVGGDWREVSPLHHVDEALPPTLVLSGTEDPEVPVETVEAFCAAAHVAGGRCDAELYEGLSHGFYHYSDGRNPWFERTGERIVAFLGDVLQ